MSTTEEKREGFYLGEDGEWIPDGWELKLAEDVCSLIVDCVNKTAPKVDHPTQFRMIRTTNIRHGRLNLQDVKYVDEETFTTWTRRAKLEKDDVLLTREAPIGEVCRIGNGEGLFLGQRIMQYRADKSVFHPPFLYWVFRSSALREQFLMHEGSGSVVSHIRVGDCFKFKTPTPSLPEQKAIAAVLGSLDDKIELLREQNETLETIAQTLFKRWFIDFNFPDENGNPYKDSGGKMIPSELGEIPEGWNDEGLTSYLDVMGGGTPKTSVPEYWNGEYYFFTPKDAKSGFYCISTEKSVTQSGIDNSSTKLFPEDTIFVTARGTVGKTSLALLPMTMNQSCYALKEKNSHNFTGFLLLREAIHKLQKYATGGVFDAITTNTLASTLMAYPSESLVATFEAIVLPIFNKIKSNSQQIQTLTQLRDTLLPKLMKGEIRIPTEA